MVLTATAQTVGEAFYIYRNDGGFNAFFREEVDSIAYSHYDLDSLYYDENVTQLVYTPDSLYRIPLAAIDSVGFVQPDNVYKPGVISLNGDILDYLVKSEGVYLYFLATTPSQLLPRVGDKLVTIEMTQMFPCGFAAEVVNVERTGDYNIVECKGLELEDVFDSYCYTVNMESDNDEAAARASENTFTPKTIHIPKLSHSWSIGVGTPLFDVDGSVEAWVKPTFHIKGTDMVDPKRGRITNIRVTGNYDTGETYSIALSKSYSKDFSFPVGTGERPVAPLLSFFWDFGVFVGVTGSVSFSQTYSQQFVSHIDYMREEKKMPTIKFDRPEQTGSKQSVPRIALNGSVRGGVFAELGFKPWLLDKDSPVGKASGRIEVGIEAEMERGIDLGGLENADRKTTLYDVVDHYGDLTRPSLTISPYASVSWIVKIGLWDVHGDIWKGKFGSPLYEGGFFPHFGNTACERTATKGSIKFSSDLSRTCPFPWQIGFSVFDKNDNHVKTEFFGRYYITPYDFDTYEVTISGLDDDAEYKVYPAINVFNHDVLASPFVTVRPCPVELSDFKVTNKQHKERGFTNDGLTYDYCFNVSVTATLSYADDVHDWGYVYRDPNGREKKISLVQTSGYGTSYTDTRWAYYRNGTPPFTCTLIPYVEYVDSDEPVYGEPHDYPLEYGETTCPDANHPHAIDLGLPSGTKWACCNVGASAPEQYGGYYAWGETHEKSVYNWDTYQYGSSEDNVVNIGSDIAGTGYDAATANWGGPWRMPSMEHCRELISSCSSTWTIQNGVYVRKFIGPNGATIFLPAAGNHWESDLNNSGAGGYYWSSTITESDSGNAYRLYFNSEDVSMVSTHYYFGRSGGRSVRPVR